MRYVFRFWFALALGLALMAGCSDENGEGGSGGTAGTGGTLLAHRAQAESRIARY